MPKNNELAVIAQESGLEPNKVETLLSSFGQSFQEAKELAATASDIVVTSEKQVSKMAEARAARLKFKNIRVAVEHTRKELKEQSVREGKAIDGMANIIKALIVPIEEHLEKQEQFAALAAAKRRADLLAERTAKLAPYVENVALYNLDAMSPEEFSKLLANSIAAVKATKLAEEQAAKEEAERRKQAALEQERIRKENEKLRKEAEAREARQAKLTARVNEIGKRKLFWNEEAQSYVRDDFNIALVEVQTLTDAQFAAVLANIDAELLKRAEALAKEEAVKEAAAKAEAEKLAKLEQEKFEREEAERKAAAEAEAAKHASMLAPDKEKLIAFAATLNNLEFPIVENEEATKLVDETRDFVQRISKNLLNKAKEL